MQQVRRVEPHPCLGGGDRPLPGRQVAPLGDDSTTRTAPGYPATPGVAVAPVDLRAHHALADFPRAALGHELNLIGRLEAELVELRAEVDQLAGRVGQRTTEHEQNEIARLHRLGLSNGTIALVTGRAQSTVKQRTCRLPPPPQTVGLDGRRRRHPRATSPTSTVMDMSPPLAGHGDHRDRAIAAELGAGGTRETGTHVSHCASGLIRTGSGFTSASTGGSLAIQTCVTVTSRWGDAFRTLRK